MPSPDPSARSTGIFRFFSLPRELRDLIYDEAWPSTPYLFRATLSNKPSPLIDITAEYRKSTQDWKTSSRIPSYMLVNRAFVDEAMKQFFRNVDWKAKIPASLFTTRVYLSNAAYHRDSILEAERELDLLTMGTKLLSWISDKDYSRTAIEVYPSWPMNLPILKKLEQGLRKTNGQKVLFVTLGVSLKRAKNILQVDLSRLEHIGFKIDKLVVGVFCNTAQQSAKRIDDLEQLLEVEMKRLGRAMIDGSTMSRVSQDTAIGTSVRWNFEISKV
jgi:hypothetical protein